MTTRKTTIINACTIVILFIIICITECTGAHSVLSVVAQQLLKYGCHLAYLFILYISINKNKHLFMKPLFNNDEPPLKKIGFKYMIAMLFVSFAVLILEVLAGQFYPFDLTQGFLIELFMTMIEVLAFYFIVATKKSSIFTNKKLVLLTALIILVLFAVSALTIIAVTRNLELEMNNFFSLLNLMYIGDMVNVICNIYKCLMSCVLVTIHLKYSNN